MPGDGDRDNLWLGKPLLEKMAANRQLFDEDKHDETESPVTVALFHHPNEWLNEYEYNTFGDRQNTLEWLCRRSHVILNGHVHARPAEPARWFNRTWIVKGGASYAEYSYRNHFSILRVDTEKREFERLAYEFDPGKNKWRKDTEYTPCHDLKISAKGPKTQQLVIPGKYKEWVGAQCGDMDIAKLAESSRIIRVSLPEIYIPLFTNPIEKQDEDREPVDIEDLIPERRTLVIQGRAGSGKTTLVKHFTHMLIQSREWKGLADCLPVLVFLKDLKGFDATHLNGNAETAEKLLAHWAAATGSNLDEETILGFCEAGKTVFFLDGLDEIDESLRELVVTSFHGFKIEHGNCGIVLSGRPHGVDGVVRKWFGESLVEILPLAMPQVEEFVRKWFEHVFESERHGVKRTAEDMIGEIRSHSSVGDLIDSPLMLTAICLLYADEKELPGQRSELYDRFVANLLYKRFGEEAVKVRKFLMSLARETHEKGARNISRVEAVRILGKQYKKSGDESDEDHNDRLNEKFDVVEPACGLLKFEKGGFGFFHLTFQEFTTANALVSAETGSHFDTIAKYWDNDWYREVVQLYIGYLSIQSSGMANNIIQKILGEDNKHFARHLLAVRSFIDIQRGNREDHVVESVVNRLWEVIGSDAEPPVRAEAGELLGRLGDARDLEVFVRIPDGLYKTSVGVANLKSFEMSKYQVTNRWFRKFIDDDGYKKTEFWTEEGGKWLERKNAEHPGYWYDHKWNCDNHPVVGVSWWEADAFCRWLTETRKDKWNYRLPTEGEWEAAAGGKEKREFPWGESFDKNKCNTDESGIGKTSAVGIFRGETPEGLSDMAGNVFELTCTNRSSDKTQSDFKRSERVAVRGGAWFYYRYSARCGYRYYFNPNYRYYFVGFRISRTCL